MTLNFRGNVFTRVSTNCLFGDNEASAHAYFASAKSPDDRASAHWTDREGDEGFFKGVRLGKRFRELLIQLGGGLEANIPWVCQDWADAKAAYRSFPDAWVQEGDILSGDFGARRERFAAAEGPALQLQDTTEFFAGTRPPGTCQDNEERQHREGQE